MDYIVDWSIEVIHQLKSNSNYNKEAERRRKWVKDIFFLNGGLVGSLFVFVVAKSYYNIQKKRKISSISILVVTNPLGFVYSSWVNLCVLFWFQTSSFEEYGVCGLCLSHSSSCDRPLNWNLSLYSYNWSFVSHNLTPILPLS